MLLRPIIGVQRRTQWLISQLPPGLTHYWPMDGTSFWGKFLAADAVGCIGGTCDGSAAIADGPLSESAVRYTGNGSNQITLSSCPITAAAAQTHAFWGMCRDINTTQDGVNNANFFQFWDGTNTIMVQHNFAAAHGSMCFVRNISAINTSVTTGTGALLSGIWAHYIFTYDGASTVKMYKNGLPFTLVADSNRTTGSTNTFGGRDGLRGLNGSMSHYMIWARALSGVEAAKVYGLMTTPRLDNMAAFVSAAGGATVVGSRLITGLVA